MMFFLIILLLDISVGGANEVFFNDSTTDGFFNDDGEELFRDPRQIISPQATGRYETDSFNCNDLCRTSRHPFVVIFLYKTSGQFLGMGSIIDKTTLLTVKRVVVRSLKEPYTLLVLAGRLSPWWGKNSQVRYARDIFVHDLELAIVKLKRGLIYNDHIMPISIARAPYPEDFGEFKKRFGEYFTGFGIPRSGWDRPGDPIKKSAYYVMKMEWALDWKKTNVTPHVNCTDAYPETDFSVYYMFCTFANATFSWGCMGSPSVTVSKITNRLEMVGVLLASSMTEIDQYHIHLKLAPFESWIKSLSPLSYLKEVDKIIL